MASGKKFSKLPELAKPKNYEIYITPDLRSFKFDGKETIRIEVKSLINEIYDLKFSRKTMHWFSAILCLVIFMIKVCKETDSLTLHSKDLDVHSASLKLKDGTGTVLKEFVRINNLFLVFNIEKDAIVFDKQWNLMTLRFPKMIQAQEADLMFTFTGQINELMEGFSRYFICI